MPKLKFSCAEPAERPLQINLSRAEIVSLIKWHCSQAKRIQVEFGKQAVALKASQPLWSGRELKRLHDLCVEQVQAHLTRAKGLTSILTSSVQS